MTGKVSLVGAGPSDAGLLTLKGFRLLQTADVVVHDALIGLEILGLIPEQARRIDVGKRAGNHPVPQEEINRILLREAQAGNHVVRLKGGDPFLFGRGGEELELLVENGIPFEIVPGVTSAVAVPAYAGIPITHRDCCSSVHIITGHTKKIPGPQIDYEALVRLDGTLVFLMGVASIDKICAGLLSAGMEPSMPAALLEQGTTARQRGILGTLLTLPGEAKRLGAHPPAIIVVGRVCALAERFAWAEKRPLAGRRIVVTRPRELASKMAASLREQGAEVLELPSVSTEAVTPNPALDLALENIAQYQWLALTSPTGVRIFLEHLRRARYDIRRLYSVRLAAIGAATAREMQSYGLQPALVPEKYSAAALGAALAREGGRILLARARDGSPDLTEALAAEGVMFDDIPLYNTQTVRGDAPRIAALINAGDIDYVAFTSASTVHGFVNLMGDCDFTKVRAACIGASTEKAAKAYGMVTRTARQAAISSLTTLMIEWNAGGY